MKVKELIELLSKQDPEKNIEVLTFQHNEWESWTDRNDIDSISVRSSVSNVVFIDISYKKDLCE